MNDIKQYIQSYVKISDEQVQAISLRFKTKKIPKKAFLFRAGDICKEFIFITKGCLHLYYTPHETDISVWFSFPFTIGSEIQSFLSGKPCKFNVQAIKSVEYLSITKSELERVRMEIPEFNNFYIKLCEEAIVDIIDRTITFQFQTAEQRYLQLLKQPNYLRMIPHKYLASYLGITPTSLSRLRKKLISV